MFSELTNEELDYVTGNLDHINLQPEVNNESKTED